MPRNMQEKKGKYAEILWRKEISFVICSGIRYMT